MAASSGPEDDDPLRDSRAYSHSIFLMLGMPFLLLGTFSYVVYRGLNKGPKPPPSRPRR